MRLPLSVVLHLLKVVRTTEQVLPTEERLGKWTLNYPLEKWWRLLRYRRRRLLCLLMVGGGAGGGAELGSAVVGVVWDISQELRVCLSPATEGLRPRTASLALYCD